MSFCFVVRVGKHLSLHSFILVEGIDILEILAPLLQQVWALKV